MQKTLYLTADAKHSYHTADAGDTLSDSGCRSVSITERMQESLNQKTDARDTLSDAAAV